MAYLGRTPSQAVRSRYYFTASGGETSLSGNDDSGNTLTFTDGNYVDVSLNGVALVAGTDYNTTTANTIGGLTALVASDIVEIIVYDTFSVFGGNVLGDFTVSNGTLTAGAVSVSSLSTTGNITFGDDDKAIFGAGSDLSIYHDGSDSYIEDSGTGDLLVLANKFIVKSASGASSFIQADPSATDVKLFFGNVEKLATTSTGVDVTGTVTADGMGIGTTSPSRQVSIVDSTNPFLQLALSTDAAANNGLEIVMDANGAYFQNRENTPTIFSTNNTERMRIDNSGNVGIGTNSPSVKLHMVRNAENTLRIEDTLNSKIMDLRADSVGGFVRTNGSYPLRFLTNSSEAMRIDSSGNVSIGTTNTSGLLTVGNGLTGTKTIALNGGGSSTSVMNLDFLGGGSGNPSGRIGYTSSTEAMTFHTGDLASIAERMRIDSSGRVGIGCSPSRNLDVENTSGSAYLSLVSNSSSGTSGVLFGDSDADHVGRFEYFNSINAMAMFTNSSERMRIDSSGNVIFGGTAVPSSSAGGAAFDPNTNGRSILKLGTTSTGNQGLAEFFNPNGQVGGIVVNGSATSYNTSSDHRLKENVVDLTGATTRLKQLEPKRFNFIADADTTVDGFLAHEVSSIVPEAVTGTKDEVDADGNPEYQGIDQSKLVPLLVATIKELEARITVLEAN